METEGFVRPVQTVIYNGLRSDFSNKEPIDRLKKFNGKSIFFAGSLKAYKGTAQLIDLARELPFCQFKAALNCDKEELGLFIQNNLIPSNLELVNRPDNIQELYLNSFLVINLSLPDECVETFGLSLLEGMFYGTPVIAPPVGGPVEFVNNENGLLADSRNTKILCEFINSLATSFPLWDKFSVAAENTAKNFTSLKYRQTIEQYFILNKLID
jgi:glycosyltransferase involved in cell wall biosynthesis